ncbi:hypothetical protein [Pseudoteredinibacter isoporae]|uniref:Uncharacterized protein n=1 Tax=Pseudoteredinibacter isoporae TaxID=570281 RepID=A0A7X0JQF6_9GAMM|nr:hypothetical protein [Pseudoteredinibacter isoporae]MBB6520404.1 hypothetical protein [Pseudoteredinibacter isoporae]NHO85972.1 hypothetical protein [Pseudoteredinibacter isoporae]NIB25576.1 hypothetical protein [Pseudoteredinibacter isoporae]
MNFKYRLLLLMGIALLGVACFLLGFRQGLVLLVMVGLIVELLVWLGRVESDFALELARPAVPVARKKPL